MAAQDKQTAVMSHRCVPASCRGVAGRGRPGADGAVGTDRRVLNIIEKSGPVFASYHIEMTAIRRRSVKAAARWETGGGGPSADRPVGIQGGVRYTIPIRGAIEAADQIQIAIVNH